MYQTCKLTLRLFTNSVRNIAFYRASTSPGGRICPLMCGSRLHDVAALARRQGVRTGCVAWKSFALATRAVRSCWGISTLQFFLRGGYVIRKRHPNYNWQFRSTRVLSHGFWCARSGNHSAAKVVLCLMARACTLLQHQGQVPSWAYLAECVIWYFFLKKTKQSTALSDCAKPSQTAIWLTVLLLA